MMAAREDEQQHLVTSAIQDAPSFSVWVLERLRAGGYRPRAWVGMLAESWAQARLTAQEQRGLTHGWRMLAGGLGMASALALGWTTRRHGTRAARLTALPLALATAAQATDIYAHLGLHRRDNARPYQHHPHLGAANALTAMRGWVASWTGARLFAGVPLDDVELALAFALVLATDIADGRVARATQQASPLGRYLDAEADLFAWLALTLTQIRRGQIPTWFLAAFTLRWGAPMALGFARTFAHANSVNLENAPIGRIAGAAQAAMSLAALLASYRAERHDAPMWLAVRNGLTAATTTLMIGATTVHLRRLLLKG